MDRVNSNRLVVVVAYIVPGPLLHHPLRRCHNILLYHLRQEIAPDATNSEYRCYHIDRRRVAAVDGSPTFEVPHDWLHDSSNNAEVPNEDMASKAVAVAPRIRAIPDDWDTHLVLHRRHSDDDDDGYRLSMTT